MSKESPAYNTRSKTAAAKKEEKNKKAKHSKTKGKVANKDEEKKREKKPKKYEKVHIDVFNREGEERRKLSIKEAAAFEKIVISRTLPTENYTRFKNKISNLRKGEYSHPDPDIERKDASHRELIAAEVEDRGETLARIGAEGMKDHKSFVKETGWYFKKNKKKNPTTFGTLICIREPHRNVPIRLAPSRPQSGNVLFTAFGSYGRTKKRDGILDIIYTLCNGDEAKERNFAKCVLSALKKKRSLTEELMDKFGVSHEELDERMDDVFLLITHFEVSRRHGYSEIEGHKTRTLPMFCALWISLELVVAGTIRLSEVFGKDSKYGLPSGEKIHYKENFKKVTVKWDTLVECYEKHFGEKVNIKKLLEKSRAYMGDESSHNDDAYSYGNINENISRSTEEDCQKGLETKGSESALCQSSSSSSNSSYNISDEDLALVAAIRASNEEKDRQNGLRTKESKSALGQSSSSSAASILDEVTTAAIRPASLVTLSDRPIDEEKHRKKKPETKSTKPGRLPPARVVADSLTRGIGTSRSVTTNPEREEEQLRSDRALNDGIAKLLSTI